MPEYRFGRKAPKEAPALMFSSFVKDEALGGNLPVAPLAVDYGVQANLPLQMLLNDQYGTCVSATSGTQRALIGKLLAGSSYYPTDDEIATFYKTQNPNFPNQDEGMVIQTALEELQKNGDKYFDGKKIVAFAKVDFTNEAELRAAHAIFGQVWYGVNVLRANMIEFNRNQPWDYVPGSPVDGGHSITGVGYDQDDYKFITWAQETSWTEAFRRNQVEEAWVVIWPEHLGTTQFQAGVDLTALADAYQQLTGRTLPVPTPPQPTPNPSPVDNTVTKTFTTEQFAALQDFAKAPHVWRKATAAAKAWLGAK